MPTTLEFARVIVTPGTLPSDRFAPAQRTSNDEATTCGQGPPELVLGICGAN